MTTTAVAYDDHGDPANPAVVLSSSLGTSRAMWDPQLAALTHHFRVIRYDHRGHGDSPAPPGPYRLADLGGDVVALLDRLGIGHAHVCGLSLGGLVGLWLAATHPDRVDRLVACCTAPAFPSDPWHERAATVRAHGTEVVADASLARWFTTGFRKHHPDVVERMRTALLATRTEGYAGCCEALAGADLTGALPGIAAPTLAIAGADDPATPPEPLERIAGGVADGHLAVVDDAAHLANIEQPERVSALIRDHLDTGGRP